MAEWENGWHKWFSIFITFAAEESRLLQAWLLSEKQLWENSIFEHESWNLETIYFFEDVHLDLDGWCVAAGWGELAPDNTPNWP